MVSRLAFVGCTVMAFAGPLLPAAASAQVPARLDLPAGTGFVLDDGVADTAAPKIKRARARIAHSAGKKVSILPPERPTELTDHPASGSAVTAAAGSASASASLNGLASLPAWTPATAPAAEPGTPPPGATVVAMLPPLRPSLPVDDAAPAPDAASALPAAMAAPTGTFVYVTPPRRPAFKGDESILAAADAAPLAPETQPQVAMAVPVPAAPEPSLFNKLFGNRAATTPPMLSALSGHGHNGIDGLVTTYAKLNGVPEALVHRIIIRESKYNPRAVGFGGALGLMQIKHGTARGLGYQGTPTGLLDAETNITYAVKYLAGAYRTAGGDFDRAVMYYARGYYYAAKAQRGGDRYASRRSRRGERMEAEARSEDGQVLASAVSQ